LSEETLNLGGHVVETRAGISLHNILGRILERSSMVAPSLLTLSLDLLDEGLHDGCDPGWFFSERSSASEQGVTSPPCFKPRIFPTKTIQDHTVMKTLVEQSSDNVNKLGAPP